MTQTNPEKVRSFTEQKRQSTHAGRARTPEQYLEMMRDEHAGVCTFCRILEEEKNWIIEGKHWNLKYNDFPYKHHQYHLVIVFKKHTEEIIGISSEIWQELGELLLETSRFFKLKGLNFVMRFGDPELRSSTIHHLHGHIQIPSNEIIKSRWLLTPEEIYRDTQEPFLPSSWISEAKELWPTESFTRWQIYRQPDLDPFKTQKLIVIKPGFYSTLYELARIGSKSHEEIKKLFFSEDFEPIMDAVQRCILKGKIAGGGLVIRFGHPSITGSGFGFLPYATIYCPNGKGRVQATFVKPLPEDKKAPCKATFCKGFEGEELEKLQKRMELFQSLT